MQQGVPIDGPRGPGSAGIVRGRSPTKLRILRVTKARARVKSARGGS